MEENANENRNFRHSYDSAEIPGIQWFPSIKHVDNRMEIWYDFNSAKEISCAAPRQKTGAVSSYHEAFV